MSERRYGLGVGRPYGLPEDPERCVERIKMGVWIRDRQCRRKRGKGPDGLYCSQHARMHEVPRDPAETREELEGWL